MKKKAALLALAMALAFTACGGKSGTEGNGDVQERTEAEADPGKAQGEEPAEEEAEPQPTQEPEQTPEPEAADEAEDIPEFSKGSVDEKGWESEWAGMRFTAPEGMKMSTEEELNALMGLSAELLSDDLGEAQIKYAELTSVKEMMCVDQGTNANVIVSIDLLPMELTEELFSQALEETLSGISAMEYEKLGEDERVELAGISFLRSGYHVEAAGREMYLDYYLKTTGMGNRALSVVVTYGDGCEEQVSAMLEGFEPYE